jgi:predicted transcriptional regulator of viral defense system
VNRVNIIDTTTGKIHFKNITVKEAADALGVIYSSVNNAIYRNRLLRGRYMVEGIENTNEKHFVSSEETEKFKQDWDNTRIAIRKSVSVSILSKITLKKVDEDDLQ